MNTAEDTDRRIKTTEVSDDPITAHLADGRILRASGTGWRDRVEREKIAW